MAAIKLFNIQTAGFDEYIATAEDYRAELLRFVRLDKPNKKERAALNVKQNATEEAAAKLLGLGIQSGKLGQKVTTDFFVEEDKLPSLTTQLKESALRTFGGEFKASSTISDLKLGQLTIESKRKYAVPGTDKELLGANILAKAGIQEEGYLLDILPKEIVNNEDALTNFLFKELFRKVPELKTIFYSKSNTILVNSFNKDGTLNRLVGMQFPTRYFNSTIFKAKKEKQAILFYVRDNFQKNVLAAIDKATITEYSNPGKRYVKIGRKKAEFFDIPPSDFIAIGLELTGSIATRPGGGINIRTKSNKKGTKSQQFISKAQMTVLVQRAVVQRMPKGPRRGPPLSDDILTYRSGRFARSVQIAFLNYKTSVIKFFYDPVYQVHEPTRSPSDLIDSSIREVTQQLYNRQFNILRA